jgi:quinol monooxygenase YgiN
VNATPAPVAVVLELRAKPGDAAGVLRWCEENLADTRAYEGCSGAEAYTDPGDPDTVVVLEHWRERGDHQAYGAWRAESGTLAGLTPLLASPPAARYLDFAKT